MAFCSSCGTEVLEEHEFCNKCGQRIKQGYNPPSREPRQTKQLELKSEGTALVLAILLGLFGLCGIGQIYCSRVGRGFGILIIGLLTLGMTYVNSILFYGEVLGSNSDDSAYSSWYVLLLFSIIVYLVIFIAQIFDAKNLARQWNEYIETHDGSRPW